MRDALSPPMTLPPGLLDAYGCPTVLSTEPEHDGPPCSGCGRPMPRVEFDAEAARGLGAMEVRRRWPRGHHACVCGTATILYDSWEHYTGGDW